MRKFLGSVILLMITTSTLFAQSQIYFSNGKKYRGKAQTINQLNAEIAKGIPVYTHIAKVGDDLSTVGFKMFTDEPLWVITEHPQNIKQQIASFSLQEFFDSWKFESAIESCIKNRNLTDLYLLQTLGKPASRTRTSDGNNSIEQWTYANLGISFFLINGVTARYVKVE